MQKGSSEGLPAVLATWDVTRCLERNLRSLFGVAAALLLGCASSGGNMPGSGLRARPGVTLIVPLFKIEGSAEIGTNDEGRRIGKAAEDALFPSGPGTRLMRFDPKAGRYRPVDEDDENRGTRSHPLYSNRPARPLFAEQVLVGPPGTPSPRGLTSDGSPPPFTVTVDDADIARLRQSLIERLRSSGAFVKVTDWRPAQVPANALMMELTVGRRGMKIDTKRFTCFIEGHVAILDKEGVRREGNVSAVGTSLVIPDSAKTEAAEKLIQSALDILDQTP
jgi:hypothetical protein